MAHALVARKALSTSSVVSRMPSVPIEIAPTVLRLQMTVYMVHLMLIARRMKVSWLLAEATSGRAPSTFCTIAAKLRDYEEVGRFESWLMRIAMNRFRDEMRRRARQANPADEATLVGLAGDGGRAEKGDETDSLPAGPLREAIEQLPEADREVLYLRHVSGLSFKQLAEALDAPVGTLLARHHRALKKVKAILEGNGGEDFS